MSAVRRLSLFVAPALLVAGLTACGADPAPAEPTAPGLEAVKISGEVGSAPKVTWVSQMDADEIEPTTLITGEGPKVADKDQVLTHLWIGNGFSQSESFSTYDEDATAELVTNDENLAPFLAAMDGATIGSRIAVTSSAENAFGEAGNAQLGIGNKDSVLVIIDLVSGIAEGPSGKRTPAPAWMPPMEFAKGDPAGFTFDGVPEPTKDLRKAVLLEGEGPVVEKGQAVVVRYLGQTFGGEAPFDENFSTGDPTSFGIGTGNVIKGWDQAIVGSTVGTRMVIEVPPDLGYGEAGNPDAGIKRTDTLVFVVDILAAG